MSRQAHNKTTTFVQVGVWHGEDVLIQSQPRPDSAWIRFWSRFIFRSCATSLKTVSKVHANLILSSTGGEVFHRIKRQENVLIVCTIHPYKEKVEGNATKNPTKKSTGLKEPGAGTCTFPTTRKTISIMFLEQIEKHTYVIPETLIHAENNVTLLVNGTCGILPR